MPEILARRRIETSNGKPDLIVPRTNGAHSESLVLPGFVHSAENAPATKLVFDPNTLELSQKPIPPSQAPPDELEIHGVTILEGPYTREGKLKALKELDQQVVGLFIPFLEKFYKTRNWNPYNVPIEEMSEMRGMLSDYTKDMIVGNYGVEELVESYVTGGLEGDEGKGGLGDNRNRRNMHLQWGSEEYRHGVALGQVILHSEILTPAELEDYDDAMKGQKWSADQHQGLDSILGGTIFAMIQERATYTNYRRLLERMRKEYGLPAKVTAIEKRRGMQFAAAGPVRLIQNDELEHFKLYIDIVKLYLSKFPEETRQKIEEVEARFHMPAMRALPNGRRFYRAVTKSGVYNEDVHKKFVTDPIHTQLGLVEPEPPEPFDEPIAA